MATTVKLSIGTSLPGRVQPAPPTGTKCEGGYQKHEIEVPPPLVGRLGASGELESTPQKSAHHSTASAPSPLVHYTKQS